TFPSESFFKALAAAMAGAHERFRGLGFFDATIGIRVLPNDEGGAERLFVLAFEVFECTLAEEVPNFTHFRVDFVLEGNESVWREMFGNVRRHGWADADQVL